MDSGETSTHNVMAWMLEEINTRNIMTRTSEDTISSLEKSWQESGEINTRNVMKWMSDEVNTTNGATWTSEDTIMSI